MEIVYKMYTKFFKIISRVEHENVSEVPTFYSEGDPELDFEEGAWSCFIVFFM